MTGLVLDTNVVSELTKREPNRAVLGFFATERDLWLSTLVMHELTFGVSVLPAGRRRDGLSDWLAALTSTYARRILPIGQREATQAALLRAEARRWGQQVDVGDALIAGTASVHGLGVATRNIADFRGMDVPLVDPWVPPAQ